MKKTLYIICLSFIAITFAFTGLAAAQETTDNCGTIQDGTITAADGTVISTGFDDFGYNYEAHMFNGAYCNYDRNTENTCSDTRDELVMKWNDNWLSNQDCNHDGKLDRPASYIGSGAWCTNHMSGWVDVGGGKMKKWTYSCKIVAVPEGAVLNEVTQMWSTAEGRLIGQNIWGQFAVTEEVYNDPTGPNGRTRRDHIAPGLGLYK